MAHRESAMKNKLITEFEKKVFAGVKKDLPEFRAGDTLRVDYRIQEGTGGKERIQAFEGVCIRVKHGTADASFTVRKIGANSVGVERVFPLYSPNLDKVVVKARGIVRRSRLYYLRELEGKAARIKSRFFGGGIEAASKAKKTDAKKEVPADKA
jgi:large subunit ribosomal protein L19